MTQLEQYRKAYAMLTGTLDGIITELESFPPEAVPPALTAGRLKQALGAAEEVFLAGDPEKA